MNQFNPFIAVSFKLSDLNQMDLSLLFAGFWSKPTFTPPPIEWTLFEKNLEGFFRAVVLDRRRRDFFPKIHCFWKILNEIGNKKRISIIKNRENDFENFEKKWRFRAEKNQFYAKKFQITLFTTRDEGFLFPNPLSMRARYLLTWPLVFCQKAQN